MSGPAKISCTLEINQEEHEALFVSSHPASIHSSAFYFKPHQRKSYEHELIVSDVAPGQVDRKGNDTLRPQ